MGCDIHIFLEIKINNKWEYLKQIEQYRNYELFAAISQDNSRFYGCKYLKTTFNNGLPDDLTFITKLLVNNIDYHSHAHLTSKQCIKLLKFCEKNNIGLTLYFKWVINDLIEKDNWLRKKGMTDFRFIYAFDN